MDLNNLTDEELCALAREGEEEAESFLLNKYKGMVRSRAKTLFLIGGDPDDLIQEGMIGLFMAVRAYEEGKGASFSSFAKLALERRMYNAIKAQNTKKNLPLNTYVSIYAGEGNEEEKALVGDLRASGKDEPETIFIDKESTDSLLMGLERELSSLEKEVLKLYLQGKDYKEIGLFLKKSPKSVDNAIQRIKKKLRKLL